MPRTLVSYAEDIKVKFSDNVSVTNTSYSEDICIQKLDKF